MMQIDLPFGIDFRQCALEHVRRLLAGGYTEERAREELLMGGAGYPGFEIIRGRIYVPWYVCPERKAFKFSELAREIRANTSTGDQND